MAIESIKSKEDAVRTVLADDLFPSVNNAGDEAYSVAPGQIVNGVSANFTVDASGNVIVNSLNIGGTLSIGGAVVNATPAELNDLAGNAVSSADFTKLSELSLTSTQLNRTIYFPDAATNAIANVATRALKFLGFDAAGEMIYTTSPGATDAVSVAIDDTAGYFTATEVESALAEIAKNTRVLLNSQVASASASIDFTSTEGLDSANYLYYEVEFEEVIISTDTDVDLLISQASVFKTDLAYITSYNFATSALANSIIINNFVTSSAKRSVSGKIEAYLGAVADNSHNRISGYASEHVTLGATVDAGRITASYDSTAVAVQVIDGLRFIPVTGTITSGRFRLYGMPR